MRCFICGKRSTSDGLCSACYNIDARAEDHQPDPPSDWEAAEEADRGEDMATRGFYGAQNEGAA